MKPDPKTSLDKKIIAVAEEIKCLSHIIYHPPSITLEKPIQDGWVRKWVLTKEALARPDRATLEEILQEIGSELHNRHPAFVRKPRRGRNLVEIKQPLRGILVDRSLIKRRPRPQEWKRYFHREYRPHLRSLQWFYVFTDTHLFELQIEPRYLTHVHVIDAQAVERKAELEAWMERHRGWQKVPHLRGIWADKSPRREKLDQQSKIELRRLQMNPEEAEVMSST